MSAPTRQLCIRSYFSRPTDLAGEVRGWPEFICGEDYKVELRDPKTNESVSVSFVESEDEGPYVLIKSSGEGQLFERVAGRVIYALSADSDNLMVDRHVP